MGFSLVDLAHSILTVERLNVAIDGAQLLSGIDLQIEQGEIVSIIGPNGAGKTTLLRAIAGDFFHTSHSVSGDVQLAGRALDQWPVADKARYVSFLPQFSSLNFPFIVFEVILMGRAPHSTGDTEDRRIVAQVAEMMDLTHLLSRNYTQLSGGEKQRVHLARVFAQLWAEQGREPRVLLLDEPTSSLDYRHQYDVMQAIQNFAKQGVAVIQVMHDVNLAAQYSQKIVGLVGGCMKFEGGVEAIIQPQMMHALFGITVDVVRNPSSGLPVIV